MLSAYQIIITGVVSFVLLVLVVNLFTFRPLGYYGFKWRSNKASREKFQPFVSILVPARNEADKIARCVRSLLAQNYPNFELIVLDDNSQDGTGAIVESLARPDEDPNHRLRLMEGAALPDGWLGKNFACHQLSQVAQGDLLLFTDADTTHSVGTLSKAVEALDYEQADFLSVFPHQQTVSMSERLMVPMMILYLVGLLPIWLIRKTTNPSLSAANGQFMLFRREAYEKIGGHRAVRSQVLEDVALGRRVKQFGFRQILPDGSDLIQCRMYRSSNEVWRGFSKNIFAFFGHSLAAFVFFMTLNLLAFVGPYLWLLLGALTRQGATAEWFWLPLLQIVLAWVLRLLLAFRFGFRPQDAFLHPVSVLYLFAIGVNSVRWSRNGSEWKGRQYPALRPRPGSRQKL